MRISSRAAQCFGFALCGVALAAAVLPAASQMTTAVLSRALLGRRLSRLQLAAVRPAAHDWPYFKSRALSCYRQVGHASSGRCCRTLLRFAMQSLGMDIILGTCSHVLLEGPQLLVRQHMARSHFFSGSRVFARRHGCRCDMTAQSQ